MARDLAQKIGGKHIETDALFHQPGWTEPDPLEFRKQVLEATNCESWAMDGNYTQHLLGTTWPRADTVVWLDYHQAIVLWRVIRRTVARLLKKTELWNGNRESWRMLFSKESIILWSLNMHYTYRRRYEKLLKLPETLHLEVVHLKSPSEAKEWIRSVSDQTHA